MRRRLLAAFLALALQAVPTWAQETGPAVPGSGSEPVDIVADNLRVEQDEQIATFTGNVQAVQGTMTLTANRLRVFYNRAEGGNAGVTGGNSSIRRIEAEGDVRLSNPTDTAEGDSGVYDVAGQKITLNGNVVLTSGKNIVRGAALDMDLRTNVSTVRSNEDTAKPQRVRARFVPGGQGS
jgi:lipopolysaccharide export system protein LptA